MIPDQTVPLKILAVTNKRSRLGGVTNHMSELHQNCTQKRVENQKIKAARAIISQESYCYMTDHKSERLAGGVEPHQVFSFSSEVMFGHLSFFEISYL